MVDQRHNCRLVLPPLVVLGLRGGGTKRDLRAPKHKRKTSGEITHRPSWCAICKPSPTLVVNYSYMGEIFFVRSRRNWVRLVSDDCIRVFYFRCFPICNVPVIVWFEFWMWFCTAWIQIKISPTHYLAFVLYFWGRSL